MAAEQSNTGVVDSVRDLVRRIENLPAPPAVATRALNMVLKGDTDFQGLAELIGADQSLSLKVLQMANSPVYGFRKKIRGIEKAAVVLGLSMLRNVLLGVVIRDTLLDDPEKGDPYAREVWRHSLSCAVTAQLIAEARFPELSDQAYAGGMIHDCGKLALLAVLPETYQDLMDRSRTENESLIELEDRVLGLDHGLVGKWLTKRWGLPDSLVDVTWLHHHPAEALDELNVDRDLIKTVALANYVVHELEVDPQGVQFNRFRNSLRDSMKIDERQIEEAKSRVGQRFAERAAVFDLENDAAQFYYEALTRARKKLLEMSMENERKTSELSRSSAILEKVGWAGLELADAEGGQEVFELVAECLKSLNCHSGFIYSLDKNERMLFGFYWGEEGAFPVHCGLDEKMELTPEGCKQRPPDNVLEVLGDYSSRIPPLPLRDNAPACLCYQEPFYVLPMVGEWEFIGELMFRPDGPNGAGLRSHEVSGFTQLSGLAAAALTRLELEDRLESRAESLSSAMLKIQQINQQLLQTERLASVGQLAAGAAHEINNPLAIIYARTQLLELKEDDADKKKNFRQMLEQIERISAILSNLMDFARPSPPKFEAVDLNEVIEKTLALTKGELDKNQLKVVRKLEKNLTPVQGDPKQLEQVFLNLVINAQHAMEESGGALTVGTSCDREKGLCSAYVKDTGVGIPREYMDKIFDPFFTTKEEGKGTGLGLSTTYGIVQGHNGEINVDSTPGKGTTVRLTLPMHPDASLPEEPADSGAQEKPSEGGEQPAGGSASILVVDDEKHIRDILVESLTGAGYEVETASDGKQGLKRLSSRRFDLLLLDIRMPLVSGLNLLSRIRKLTRRMPVIVLTGHAGPDEMREALELGAAKIVRKPFQIDKLLAEVRDALGGAEGES